MDRTAIEELFTFSDYSWSAYEAVIRPLGADTLTKPAPGSGWPALSNALAHMNWAYVRWLASPSQTTNAPVEEVKSWEDVAQYRGRVRGDARKYLDSLSDAELLERRGMNVDGATLVFSPADIFAHVFMHERQHHGDLNTLLYQLGIEVPLIEYRFSLPQPDR